MCVICGMHGIRGSIAAEKKKKKTWKKKKKEEKLMFLIPIQFPFYLIIFPTQNKQLTALGLIIPAN